MLKVDGGGCVSELVKGDAQAGHFLNARGDLIAKMMRIFMSAVAPGNSDIVRAPQQGGPEFMDIFIDDGRDTGI